MQIRAGVAATPSSLALTPLRPLLFNFNPLRIAQPSIKRLVILEDSLHRRSKTSMQGKRPF